MHQGTHSSQRWTCYLCCDAVQTLLWCDRSHHSKPQQSKRGRLSPSPRYFPHGSSWRILDMHQLRYLKGQVCLRIHSSRLNRLNHKYLHRPWSWADHQDYSQDGPLLSNTHWKKQIGHKRTHDLGPRQQYNHRGHHVYRRCSCRGHCPNQHLLHRRRVQ